MPGLEAIETQARIVQNGQFEARSFWPGQSLSLQAYRTALSILTRGVAVGGVGGVGAGVVEAVVGGRVVRSRPAVRLRPTAASAALAVGVGGRLRLGEAAQVFAATLQALHPLRFAPLGRGGWMVGVPFGACLMG